MKIETSIKEINRILDHESQNINRLFWVCDRLTWMKKFNKASNTILDALIAKTTYTIEGSWYGDEPEERIILNYISTHN